MSLFIQTMIDLERAEREVGQLRAAQNVLEGKMKEQKLQHERHVANVSERLYRIANHIAGAKGSLPNEWQDWISEIEDDIRGMAATGGKS